MGIQVHFHMFKNCSVLFSSVSIIKKKQAVLFLLSVCKSVGTLHSYLVPLFLRLDLLKVEFQFLAFQNVAIRATALSGAGRNAGCSEEKNSINISV